MYALGSGHSPSEFLNIVTSSILVSCWTIKLSVLTSKLETRVVLMCEIRTVSSSSFGISGFVTLDTT